MNAESASLTVALIAAAASVGGLFYTQLNANKLEERKWQQTQQDALRGVVVDFAKEITTAHQRAEWLVWIARNTPDALDQRDFDAFNTEAKASLPRIFGLRVLLTAKRPAAYVPLEKTVADYYSADACIGFAAAAYRKKKADGIRSLLACADKVESASATMVQAFSAAMQATNALEPVPK
jgi:hypothetical protein